MVQHLWNLLLTTLLKPRLQAGDYCIDPGGLERNLTRMQEEMVNRGYMEGFPYADPEIEDF